jgi:hypothetical protein
VPFWLALIVVVFYASFGAVLVRSLLGPVEGVRIIIPSYGLLGYLTLAVALNWRRAVVTPSGIRVSTLPFPCAPGKKMTRHEIWLCYVRRLDQVVSSEASLFDKSEISYVAGVEDAHGRRVDISRVFKSPDDARRDAQQIIGILNQNATGRRVELQRTSESNSADQRAWRWRVVAWMSAFMTTLAIGIIWELQ